MSYENCCKSCYSDDINDSMCNAPCGHRFCFGCIVLMAKLNHRCPLCYENIMNNIGKKLPFQIEYVEHDEDDEDNDDIVIMAVAVDTPKGRLIQNLNTKKCLNPETKKEVYLTAIDLELTRLSIGNYTCE